MRCDIRLALNGEGKKTRYLDKLFKQVGVPLARFPVSEKYPTRVVEENIKRVIQRQATQSVEQNSWEYMQNAG